MALDINHVVLIGRLTKDAEQKSLASGQSVTKFSIAVNRRRKNGEQWEDEPNFFDIVVWGRQGESLSRYLEKGKMVCVDGELRQDRWTDSDGKSRSKVEIVAANVQLLGGSPGGRNAGSSGDSGGSGSPQGGGRAPRGDHAPAEDSFADDIPF